MDLDDLVRTLTAVERRLATRVQIVRVVVDADGVPTGRRIHRGNIQAPADWTPPSFEELMRHAREVNDRRKR